MNVLVVSDCVYIHTRRWVEGLRDAGVSVSVLTPRPVAIEGVRMFPADVPAWGVRHPARWLSRWRAVFRRALAGARPDLIHVHFPDPYSVLIDEIPTIPLVVSTWGAEILPMAPEREPDRAGRIALLRRADHVVALSHYLAVATARYAGLDPGSVRASHWGVDLDQFKPPARPCEAPVIGFAKAFTPKYGPEYLIDALPRILREVPAARVRMLGAGPTEAALRRRAAGLGVAGAIDWVGRCDHARIADQYAGMALSVMPSTHESETLGVSALESQAMGVPVVASRIGGIPESVIDGRTGLLVPPRDPDALAHAILALLRDDDRRHALGRQGRAHVERHFDWRDTISRMVALYRDTPSPRDSSGPTRIPRTPERRAPIVMS